MFENRPLSADDLQNSIIPVGDKGHIGIRPLTTDELPPETLDAFLAVGFTNHYEILAQKKDIEQRLFYIVNCATGFWNGGKLLHEKKLESKHGSGVVNRLSVDLKQMYPEMGVSPRNLWDMKKFYERFKEQIMGSVLLITNR